MSIPPTLGPAALLTGADRRLRTVGLAAYRGFYLEAAVHRTYCEEIARPLRPEEAFRQFAEDLETVLGLARIGANTLERASYELNPALVVKERP